MKPEDFPSEFDKLHKWAMENWPFYAKIWNDPETRIVTSLLHVAAYDKRLSEKRRSRIHVVKEKLNAPSKTNNTKR